MNNFITITGSLGSGKSTLCAMLKDREDYKHIYAGEIFRSIAKERNISLLDLNNVSSKDFTLDYELDNYIKNLSIDLKGQKVVFDSRLAWHTVANSYKVFVYCNDEIASERVFSDNRGSVENYSDKAEAILKLKRRRELETSRYKREYGIDYYDFNNYDIVIDTSYLNIEEAYDIMVKMGIVYIEPQKLYPTQNVHGMSDETVNYYTKMFKSPDCNVEPIEVIKYENDYFIHNGHHRAIAATSVGLKKVQCKVIKGDIPKGLSISMLYDYQDAIKYEGNYIPDIYNSKRSS